jgi:hypothetical protein
VKTQKDYEIQDALNKIYVCLADIKIWLTKVDTIMEHGNYNERIRSLEAEFHAMRGRWVI